VSSAAGALGLLYGMRTGGGWPLASPRWAKLSCLLREETAPLPGGRAYARTADRGCERAGGGAGCHAETPEDAGLERPQIGRIGSPPGECAWRAEDRFDWVGAAGNVAPESASAGRWLLSTQLFEKTGGAKNSYTLVLVLDWRFEALRFAEE
jgi:hypothetical protein